MQVQTGTHTHTHTSFLSRLNPHACSSGSQSPHPKAGTENHSNYQATSQDSSLHLSHTSQPSVERRARREGTEFPGNLPVNPMFPNQVFGETDEKTQQIGHGSQQGPQFGAAESTVTPPPPTMVASAGCSVTLRKKGNLFPAQGNTGLEKAAHLLAHKKATSYILRSSLE